MPDPHLICADCERAEGELGQPFCDACRKLLESAHLALVDHEVAPSERIQIGPTDI